MTSEDILKLAVGGKKLALDNNTWEAPRGQGPAPSDFGEHEPIPEEAVTIQNVMVEGREWRPTQKVENPNE